MVYAQARSAATAPTSPWQPKVLPWCRDAYVCVGCNRPTTRDSQTVTHTLLRVAARKQQGGAPQGPLLPPLPSKVSSDMRLPACQAVPYEQNSWASKPGRIGLQSPSEPTDPTTKPRLYTHTRHEAASTYPPCAQLCVTAQQTTLSTLAHPHATQRNATQPNPTQLAQLTSTYTTPHPNKLVCRVTPYCCSCTQLCICLPNPARRSNAPGYQPILKPLMGWTATCTHEAT